MIYISEKVQIHYLFDVPPNRDRYKMIVRRNCLVI
jgi:hypothetical protein